RVRRREGRRDSITRFADARKAMSVSQGKPAVRLPKVTAQEAVPGSEAPNVVVHSGSAPLFDPLARRRIAESRRSFRRDPETLARGPTVALLPTLLSSHGEADVKPLTPAGETDAKDAKGAKPPVVSMPVPHSEAS